MAWCMLKAISDKSSSAPSTLEGHGKQGVELDFSISTHNTFDLIFFMYQDVVADLRRLFMYILLTDMNCWENSLINVK